MINGLHLPRTLAIVTTIIGSTISSPAAEPAPNILFIAIDDLRPELGCYSSYNGGKAEMLYDLEKDPGENINVANDPEYRQILQRLTDLLKQRQLKAERFKE